MQAGQSTTGPPSRRPFARTGSAAVPLLPRRPVATIPQQFLDGASMSTRLAGLIVLGAFLATGVAVQAHHAVAGVYDLNKEVVLEGRLKKLNFTNPHASIELEVPDKKVKGKITEWKLTTASIQILTREGINKTSMKPGEILKVTILPAKNGNPAGFIRSLQLGDRNILLFFGDGTD
jgi:hypothetical protein